MYGILEVGGIANKQLVGVLEPFGYAIVSVTSGLWWHKASMISFTLVFDDFGVKYTG